MKQIGIIIEPTPSPEPTVEATSGHMRIVDGHVGGCGFAVAALLLKGGARGHRRIHEQLGEKDESGVCTSERDWADVARVCDLIDIPYYSVNFANEYRERVFARFWAEYEKSRTHNPDVLCNREIKLSAFLDFALKLGADRLATGHFSRIWARRAGFTPSCAPGTREGPDLIFCICSAQRALSYAMFPVGNLLKSEVREIARAAGLPGAISGTPPGMLYRRAGLQAFLKNLPAASPRGEIVDESGKVRRAARGRALLQPSVSAGGWASAAGARAKEWFVVEKDAKNNRLVVAQARIPRGLYTKEAYVATHVDRGRRAGAVAGRPGALRHRQPLQAAPWRSTETAARVSFGTPQRAVTPGQSAVFYLENTCLGGGIVE
jgi:tRNA-specific 2-thiouridylase